MRLIDADVLERYIQTEWENNRLCNEAWITFREMLKACPTISTMRWISSKEMLPDRDMAVVGVRKRPPDVSEDVWDAWVCTYDDRYGWLDIDTDRVIEGISHWLPLSNMPEEERIENDNT